MQYRPLLTPSLLWHLPCLQTLEIPTCMLCYSGMIKNLTQPWIKPTQSPFLHQLPILTRSFTLLTSLYSLHCSTIKTTTSAWWLEAALGTVHQLKLVYIRIIDNCSLLIDNSLVNYCLSSEINNNITTTADEIMAPKSINDSTLDGSPQQHGMCIHFLELYKSDLVIMLFSHTGTIDPLVPSMIVSHLFLAALSCTIGIIVGCLLYRCYVLRRAQQTTSSPPEPVYTEIALSANEAYGQINP